MAAKPSQNPRAALMGRLLAGHFACYPMMFAATAATMSLSIILQKERLLELGRVVDAAPGSGFQGWLVDKVGLAVSEAAIFEVIISPIVYLALIIFIATHVASVPWALAARRAALEPEDEDNRSALSRATTRFFIASAGTTGLFVVAGMIGWIIIFAS